MTNSTDGLRSLPALLEWLRERREPMSALTMQLARLESPTTVPESQGPVFARLQAELEDLGYLVRRSRGRATGGTLYARPRRRARGRPAQMIVGHVDTVWPVGTVERMPVLDDEGIIRGPGVFDMKGGLAQLIFALRALRAFHLQPEVTPVVFLNSDEEVHSPESTGRIRLLARHVVRALVLEPALGPSGKLKTTRRGAGSYHVVVTGRSAHAGLAPEDGASAIQEMSFVVQALHALSDPERGITVNVGRIHGGERPNVVAAEAAADVDARACTLEDARDLDDRIHALVSHPRRTPGTSLRIEGGMDRPPMEGTPRNRTLWAAARRVGAALHLDLEEGMSGGGSDGNTTSLFTATLDGLGAVGAGAHAVDEHVESARMPERAALLAGLLLLPAEVGEDGAFPALGMEGPGMRSARRGANAPGERGGVPRGKAGR